MMQAIPIKIFPAYWIFTAILSLILAQGNILQTFVWMIIIFISVLFHEFGHALTAKAFGRRPRIELVGMGGLTYHDGDRLSFWKQFFITLNGPLFGLILAFIAHFMSLWTSSPIAHAILAQIFVVNIYWTVINLFPILPLDGGQLLRIGLEKFFDVKGLRYTFWVSGILSLLASLGLFATQNILGGAIFFLFAFENFSNFRKARYMQGSDRKDELKEAMAKAELLLRQGQQQEALEAFQGIRATASGGMLYDAATQYCALILDQQRQSEAAYDLLKPLQERLDPPMLMLLQRLAFDRQDDLTVATIGALVFQHFPLAEVALRNAYTAARLKQPEGAIGWLETAQQNGVENIAEIVKEAAFDRIRKDPSFKQFVQKLSKSS